MGPADAIEALQRDDGMIVSRHDVLRWMASDDLETLGAVDALIDSRRGSRAIRPPLTMAEVDEFRRRYWLRCIREDPGGGWASSRYEAGWDIAGWIVAIADRPDCDAGMIERWKRLLADEYRRGDAAVGECIINATLEHVFERHDLRRRFDDWRADPVLKVAFDRACESADRRP